MTETLQKWRDALHRIEGAAHRCAEVLAELDSTLCANEETTNIDEIHCLSLVAEQDVRGITHSYHSILRLTHFFCRMRNKSITLIPFNRLPQEARLAIFGFCARKQPHVHHNLLLCSGNHYSFRELLKLTHVCAEWRRTLVATPSLWSHVDMELLDRKTHIGGIDCIRLSMRRAGALPLCFDFNHAICSHETSAGIQALNTPTGLKGCIKNLQTIYLWDWRESSEVDALLELWFHNSQVDSVENLVIWRDPMRSNCDPFVLVPSRSLRTHGLRHLLAVRVLRLSGMALEWDSPVYHNLVRLSLGDLPARSSPSIFQIRDVLATCPRLHTLSLSGMYILTSEDPQPPPVAMDHLKVLDIYSLYEPGPSLLLPLLIIPRANALSFRTHLHSNSFPAHSAVKDFLACTNVTRLCVDQQPSDKGALGTLQECLAITRNLEALVCNLGGYNTDAHQLMVAMSQLSRTLIPRLHALYIFNGKLKDDSVLQTIKARLALEKLVFISCNLDEESVRQMQSFLPYGDDYWDGSEEVCRYAELDDDFYRYLYPPRRKLSDPR